MISITKTGNNIKDGNKPILEIRGLSNEKPTENIPNGSIYICTDTGEVFIYDAENQEWNKI